MTSAEKGPYVRRVLRSMINFVRRQSAGLVVTQDGNTRQFFNGGDTCDDGLVLCKLLRTNGQCDG